MKTFKRILLFYIVFAVATVTAQATTISETHVNNTCNGYNAGSIDITPSGGTTPYTYSWSSGETTQDLTNLIAGTYVITVTDNLGVTASLSINITEPAGMSFSKAIIHVFCGGDSTGDIDLTVTGGNPGYTYSWADGVTTEDRHNVFAANYYFTVTDAIGCQKNDSANVTQPPGMVTTITGTDATCSGSNGTIDLTVQYGIPGYFYAWSDGATTEDRTGMAAGTYTVTISDNSTCTVSASATVGLTITGMSINTTSTNPTCTGGSNGTITVVSVIGSVGPYTFAWSDGPTSQNRTGLGAGTYVVTATSSTTCSVSASVTLVDPLPINISLTAIPVSCNGGSNGAINTTRSGGTAPYSYIWNDGAFTQNRTGLATGNYSVTITDFNGCTASATVFISQPLFALVATAVPSPLACIGGPSGSVITTVTGGTGPYTYWWGGGVMTQNRINVPSGNYCVTATDANGCVANACAIIPGYTPLSISSTQINASCFGDSSGSVNITVSNGSTPYSYFWSNSETTEDLDTLKAGTYSITVTDNNLCTITRTITISQSPFPLTINSTVADPQCYGTNDGSISVNPVNGTAPYSYIWNDGPVTQNRTGLTSGNFSVTVSDNFGCSALGNMTVVEPSPMVITPSVIDVVCSGTSTGTVNLSVTGSFAPYSYDWNDGGDTQNRNNIPAGNYTVLIIDNHNCSGTASASVIEPAPVVIATSSGNPACFGDATGWINVNVTGGTFPYTYDWGGAVTTQNRGNLTAGNYSVVITDSAGCLYSASVTISEPSAIIISSTVTSVACNGGNDGTINLTVTGGTSPYSFNWGGAITTQNRTNLIAGSYTVTVTDSAGCTSLHTATISQSTTLAASSTVTDASCSSSSNGAINITVSGGVAPYSFLWNDSASTQNRINLFAGTYTVTVTDNSGCNAIHTATVAALPGFTVSSVVTNATCDYSSNGAIGITMSGGISPYIFNWNDSVTVQNRINLTAGTYTVTVTDITGCNVVHIAPVSSAPVVVASATAIDAACNGASNGAINVTVSGGVSPYLFNWNDGILTQNRTNIPAGNYSLILTDSNSCTATTSAIVSEPAAITITSSVVNTTCFGSSDGNIDLTVTGGTGTYIYSWSNGASTQDLSNIPAANYLVNITDSNNCIASTSVTLTEPAQIILSTTQVDVGCNGINSGSIDLTVNGGTLPYTYIWSNSQVTQDISNLTVGNYFVTVRDNNLCSAASSASIVQSAPLAVYETHANVSCNGGSDGSINTTVSGGSAPYTYNWGGNILTPDRINLAEGYYSVTVTDNSNCTAETSVTITEPYAITLMIYKTDASCTGAATGSINLTVIGGTSGYTFNWNDGAVTQNRVNLPAGNYSVILTDGNSCTATTGLIIVNLDTVISSFIITDVSCYGGSNGIIDLTVSGGTAPYSFVWSNNLITEDISSLAAGNYSVEVTDVNNCSTANSVTINQPTLIQISQAVTGVSCFGGSNGAINITVVNGVSPYSFLWSNSSITEDISAIVAGNYQVTVTDANSCTLSSANIVISQSSQLNVSSIVVSEGCANHSDGEIDLSVSGGMAPYTFLWNDFSPSQDRINLTAGNYSVTVTDQNGCTSAKTDSIGALPPINISSSTQNSTCLQIQNGNIDLTVTGGMPSYIFNWSNGINTEDINNLGSGNYSVTITDSRDCSAQAAFNISFGYDFQLNTAAQANIDAGETVELTVNTSTDYGNTYLWLPGEHVRCADCRTTEATPVFTTYYTVIVTDSNGCIATDTLEVNVESGTDIFVPNAFTPNTDGVNDFLELYGDKNGIAFLDFAVFNRWGEKVFQSSDYNFAWDGVYKNEVVPQGVYVYVMKVVFGNDYSRNSYTGSVTVIR